MSPRGSSRLPPLAYGLSLGILSVAVFTLFVLLFAVCKKRSIQPEDALPIKLPARSYSLAEVDAATDGFSRRGLLGQGPHGSVYQAILPTGELVAVKRVHPHLVLGGTAGSGFSSTIKSLSWVHHPHIVPILGYAQGPGERIIITGDRVPARGGDAPPRARQRQTLQHPHRLQLPRQGLRLRPHLPGCSGGEEGLRGWGVLGGGRGGDERGGCVHGQRCVWAGSGFVGGVKREKGRDWARGLVPTFD